MVFERDGFARSNLYVLHTSDLKPRLAKRQPVASGREPLNLELAAHVRRSLRDLRVALTDDDAYVAGGRAGVDAHAARDAARRGLRLLRLLLLLRGVACRGEREQESRKR